MAFPQSNVVSQGEGSDLSSALHQALIHAIQQVRGTVVVSEDHLVDDRLVSSTQQLLTNGVIRQFSILSQAETSGGIRVTVSAEVAPALRLPKSLPVSAGRVDLDPTRSVPLENRQATLRTLAESVAQVVGEPRTLLSRRYRPRIVSIEIAEIDPHAVRGMAIIDLNPDPTWEQRYNDRLQALPPSPNGWPIGCAGTQRLNYVEAGFSYRPGIKQCRALTADNTVRLPREIDAVCRGDQIENHTPGMSRRHVRRMRQEIDVPPPQQWVKRCTRIPYGLADVIAPAVVGEIQLGDAKAEKWVFYDGLALYWNGEGRLPTMSLATSFSPGAAAVRIDGRDLSTPVSLLDRFNPPAPDVLSRVWDGKGNLVAKSAEIGFIDIGRSAVLTHDRVHLRVPFEVADIPALEALMASTITFRYLSHYAVRF